MVTAVAFEPVEVTVPPHTAQAYHAVPAAMETEVSGEVNNGRINYRGHRKESWSNTRRLQRHHGGRRCTALGERQDGGKRPDFDGLQLLQDMTIP